MAYLRFKDRTKPIQAKAKKLNSNQIEIAGCAVNTSGFLCYLDAEQKHLLGDYSTFTTLYQKKEESFILSNDGSVYVEPETKQEPAEPYIPTLEEVQEAKVAEMNVMQQAVIQAGVHVTLTDGTTEHFTLTDHDQTSLMGLQTQVAAGMEHIPWHTSDQAEHCKYYSNTDMALITTAALSCVTWHVTYFRDLRIYIRSLQTKEEVEAVVYGMTIPEEYHSEPLKDMIAAQNA